MPFADKLLQSLSNKQIGNNSQIQEEYILNNALSGLDKVFPHFIENIVGKTILDFGCGTGYQSNALVNKGANYVLGIDINQKSLQKARNLATELGNQKKVEFYDKFEAGYHGKFDIVFSQNSFEHYNDPSEILKIMESALKPEGKIFITFGPPWFAPYGSHMQFFCKIPWLNIIFPEKTVMRVRSRFRNDGASKYEEVESGLNKMTVSKFEKIILNSGMKIIYKRYDCVKNINFLNKVPFIRELFINNVSCIIEKDKK